MQCTIFLILPTWAVFFAFSLPSCTDPAYINIISTNGKEDAVKQPEANTDLLYFWLRVIIKADLLKKISLYLLWHSHIRIILLTCTDNINVILQVCKKSSAEIKRTCKITHTTMMRGQYYFNWNLRSLSICSSSCEDLRVPPINLWDISISEDLYCLKAIHRNSVQSGGNNTDAFSLCSQASVSEQIANNVLFWLRLSEM